MWKTPFKKFEVIWCADHITSNSLKTVFHKFYLVFSWIPWPKCFTVKKKKFRENKLLPYNIFFPETHIWLQAWRHIFWGQFRYSGEIFFLALYTYFPSSPLICGANQWIGFYMISTSVVKELSSKITFSYL